MYSYIDHTWIIWDNISVGYQVLFLIVGHTGNIGKSTKNHVRSIKQLAWDIFSATGNECGHFCSGAHVFFQWWPIDLFGSTHNICEYVNAFIMIQ